MINLRDFLLLDTGPIVAALNKDDNRHKECTELLKQYKGKLLVPSLVVAEVSYMLQTQAGVDAELEFIHGIATGEFFVANVQTAQWERVEHLMRKYKDFPLGTTDAVVITLAEHFKMTKIASLDKKHMLAVKPEHCDGFELLPA